MRKFLIVALASAFLFGFFTSPNPVLWFRLGFGFAYLIVGGVLAGAIILFQLAKRRAQRRGLDGS